MSKYKVGDRVVVISKEEADKKKRIGTGFVLGMKKYCGKTVTIESIYGECGFTKYYIEEDWFVWCDEFFEGLEEDVKREFDGKIWSPITLNLKGENKIMDKKDILAVRNYNDRAMVMQFDKKDKNGKNVQTRAEVHDGDTFDLDNGIRICLLKYLLGGHKKYMAIMDAARKSYKKTVTEDQKKAAEKCKKAIAPVKEAIKKMEEKERRDKEVEELITKAIKKALVETGEKENKSVEE